MRLRRSIATGGAAETATETFLALFLIVLAFFILLTSISKREEDRAKAVLGSLGSTFSENALVVTGPLDYTFGTGVYWTSGAAEKSVRGLFQSTFPLARIPPYQPFGSLVFEVPADEVFVSGGSLLQAQETDFLERLATILVHERPGIVFETEIIVFVTPEAARAEGESPARALALARAGAFARALVDRGVAPARVSAGIAEGQPGVVRLAFFEREAGGAPTAPAAPAGVGE